MSLNVTFNGSMYIIPETGEVGWGGNTTSYLVAIAAGALQKTGGSFTLSAEIDFGASFGVKSLYYKSRSANIAAAGILRLNNNSDSINWRNAANSADLALFPNASNLLTFNGSTVYVIGAGTITNADIAPGAGIVYSKLNLTNSIVNADVNTAAAIAYSKLNLALSIVNADINASAAIAYSKLNLSNSIVNADINAAAAIVYSKLTLTNSIVNADINATAAIAFTKMAAMTASRMTVSNTSGFLIPSAWSYNATDDLTTGPNDELRFQDTTGGEYVALRAPAAVTTHSYDLPIAPGTAGQVLSWQTGGQLTWINAAGGGTINSGLAGFFTYYPANGTTVDDQALLFTDLTNLTLTSGQWLVPTGTAALPTYSFTGDPDTGMYRVSANKIGWSAGGTLGLSLDTGILDLTANTGLYMPVGSVTAPVLANRNNTDSGFYWPTSTSIAFSADGVVVATLRGDNSVDLGLFLNRGYLKFGTAAGNGGDGTAAAPILTWENDPDTGIYHVGANSLGFSAAGTQGLRIETNDLIISRNFLPNADATYPIGASGSGFTRIFINNGTASAPSYTFSTETTFGWYRPGTSRMGLGSNGTLAIDMNVATGYMDFTGNMNIASTVGTVSVPSFAHRNNLDTGFYWPTSTSIGFSVDGTQVVTLRNDNGTDSGIYIPVGFLKMGQDGSATAPKISWENDPDIGIYRAGTDSIGIATGGARAILISSTQAVAIKGTNTNDNATAGDVGQTVTATQTSSTNFPTSNQYGDLTSVSLTAGDWLVGAWAFINTTGDTVTSWQLGLSTTSGNSGTGLTEGDTMMQWDEAFASGNQKVMTIPSLRFSLSATTTVYLKYLATYSAGTPQSKGRITAVRIR